MLFPRVKNFVCSKETLYNFSQYNCEAWSQLNFSIVLLETGIILHAKWWTLPEQWERMQKWKLQRAVWSDANWHHRLPLSCSKNVNSVSNKIFFTNLINRLATWQSNAKPVSDSPWPKAPPVHTIFPCSKSIIALSCIWQIPYVQSSLPMFKDTL